MEEVRDRGMTSRKISPCSASATQVLELPEDVVSLIMSLLQPPNLPSAALVCQSWHSIIARVFHKPNFKQSSSFHTFDSFVDFVESCLAQYLKHHPISRTLKVSCHPGFNTRRFNNLLDFTANNNFHYLRLYLLDGPPFSLTTLRWCNSLTHLALQGQYRIDVQLIDQIDELFVLDVLELRSVYINEATLSKLLTKCPSLEDLVLEDCKELVNVEVPPHTKLDGFYLSNYIEPLGFVKVEAADLFSFSFSYHVGGGVPLVDLQACRKLHSLCLQGIRLPNIYFDFPHLQRLSLSFELIGSGNLTMLTPNLRWFHGMSSDMKILSLPIHALDLFKAKITVINPLIVNKDWFVQLRSHVTRLRKDAILCLNIKVDQYFIGEFGDVNDPAPRIKHLKIALRRLLNGSLEYCWWPRCKCLIDAIFFCCRPSTLSVKWIDEDKWFLNHSFAESLRNALEDLRCNYKYKNGWRRYLKCFAIKRVVGRKGHKKMLFAFEWYD